MIDLIFRKLFALVLCICLLLPLSIHSSSLETFYYEPIIEKEKVEEVPIQFTPLVVLIPEIKFQDFSTKNLEGIEEYLSYLEQERDRIYNHYTGAEKINLFLIEEEIEYINSLIKWTEKKKEYPIATEVWLFLKNELGWSDIACAGALGNMMAEVGGQTLELDYDLWDESGEYYGICQWVDYYCPEVMGADLQGQLNYLKNTVEFNMNEWNIPYESFLNAKTPEEAALLFAEGYERCNVRHYYVRTINAVVAYNYFVGSI